MRRNELIQIKENKKTPDDIKHLAAIYMEQVTTASNDLIKEEVDTFIENNKYYLK